MICFRVTLIESDGMMETEIKGDTWVSSSVRFLQRTRNQITIARKYYSVFGDKEDWES